MGVAQQQEEQRPELGSCRQHAEHDSLRTRDHALAPIHRQQEEQEHDPQRHHVARLVGGHVVELLENTDEGRDASHRANQREQGHQLAPRPGARTGDKDGTRDQEANGRDRAIVVHVQPSRSPAVAVETGEVLRQEGHVVTEQVNE